MKVVLFHPTLLPPKDYGGVERVVLWLAKGLVELGHDVFVAAFPQSRLPAGVKLLPVAPDRASARELLTLLPAGVDLVHFQAPPEEGVWEQLPCPGLLTVHGNGKPGERFPANTVFLSQDHARRHGASEFVFNGVDPAEYLFEPRSKRDQYLFLSKTSWRVKNLQGAMRLCRRAGVPLAIAGGNRPLSARLRASLDPSLEWLGPVAGTRKAEILARAKALVFPVRWSEPFGLVVVEALISGTPVLAPRRGSLPELISSEVGALLDDPDENEEQWISLLQAPTLPWAPERCRAHALANFHYAVMAKSYERVYQRLRAGEVLHPGGVRGIPPASG